MTSFRTFSLVGVLVSTLAACAQPPLMTGHDSRRCHDAHGMAHGMSHAHMAMMDSHMKKMREMQAKWSAARTPEDRNALMPEHMKLMQEGMGLMGGTGGHHGVGAQGGPVTYTDMHARHLMMEKHMEMMRSTMQMMMDRMHPTAPSK